MKKKMFIGLVAMFLAASLTGCGKPAHTFAEEWATNKTQHWHECIDEDCEEKDSLGDHTFVNDPAQAVAATCTATGKTVEVCSVCAYEKETTIPKIDHNYVEVPAEAVAATCTEPGKTVERCSVCQDEKETVIEALGHDFVLDEAATIQNSLGKNVQKYACSRCDEESYTMAVSDYSFLTEGSQSFFDEPSSIPEADQAEAGEGIRIVGGGSIKWKFPIQKTSRYSIAIGANPAPSGIGNPNIEQKNGIKVDGVDLKLIPSGGYTGLGLVLGQFNELVMAEFDAVVTDPISEVEIEITQVASQRLFWGGVVRLTPIPPHEHDFGEPVLTAGADAVTEGETLSPALVGYGVASCRSCLVKKFIINALDAHMILAEGSTLKSDSNVPQLFKLNANGNSATFNVNLTAGITGKLYLDAIMDGYPANATAGLFYQSNPSFEIKVNDVAIDLSSKSAVTYSQLFGDEANPNLPTASPGGYSPQALVEVGDVALNAGVNPIIYKRLTTKNLLIQNFVIIY